MTSQQPHERSLRQRATLGLGQLARATTIRIAGAALVVVAVVGLSLWLQQAGGYGTPAVLSLWFGVGLGVVFERGRFCFFCILRECFEERNSTGIYAILAALAVGGLGYVLVAGAFLPDPSRGRLPPGAHIGPISPVLVAGGVAFGVGMCLAGGCISGLLYRVGEGYSRAPIGLLGVLLGFGLGFYSWNTLYLSFIAQAPVWWLPAWLGYGGALALHLAILGGVAVWLLPFLPNLPARAAQPISLSSIGAALFGTRWNPLPTGALVGVIGAVAYFRVEPLGVTAQLGSISRTVLHDAGALPARLYGLDTLAGCATQVGQAITTNGWLIGGLVAGSFAAALLANRFQISSITPRNSGTALLGGILMGWGAMVSLGCTVGVLLSGISVFALSGWVFTLAMLAGVWLGLRLRLHHL